MFNIIDTSYYIPLCEYYNVTIEEAITLGTRSDGRKPSLPGSATCSPVSNKTLEELWSLKPRNNVDDVFEFYRDQGSWSSFRQMVRHKDMFAFHQQVLQNVVKQDTHLCEYGCGVAPFSSTLLSMLDHSTRLTISVSDVDCEHFSFGVWRLQKAISKQSLNVDLSVKQILSNELPKYSKPLDAVILFEVLEHVPSPLATARNILEQMNVGGLLVENFIKHVVHADDEPGPDLLSASLERDKYYELLSSKMSLVSGLNHIDYPNHTRTWKML